MHTLDAIIATLNRIEVSGRDNLSRLLGCLQALEKIREEETHHDRHDQQG